MAVPSFDGAQVTASDTTGNPNGPLIASLSGGGFVVGWNAILSGTDPDGGSSGVVRVFDADRSPVGDGVAVPADLNGSDPIRHLIGLPDGGFAALYVAGPLFGTGAREARVARFDASGAQVGADAAIPLPEFGDAVGLAAFEDGRIGVLSADFTDVTLSVIAADGTVTLDRAPTGLDVASIGAENRLVQGRDGEVVALIVGAGTPVSRRDVSIVGLDDAGDVTFSTQLFDDDDSGGGFAIERLSDGAYIVVSQVGGGALRTVRVAEDGTAGPILTLGAFGNPGGSLADVAADAEGGFTVILNDFGGGATGGDGLGVKVDAAGAVEGAFRLHRTEAGDQTNFTGAYIADGDLIASFLEFDASFRAVAAIQGFDPSGTTAGAAPTDIVLTADPLTPGAVGVAIGTLSAVDADPGDTFTFEIVSGPAFEIDGDVLRLRSGVAADRDFTDEVRIRVTDSQSNLFEETLSIPFEAVDPGPTPVIWTGGRGADRRKGGDGDDMLSGRGGKDRLFGLDGADTLDGGSGRDRLKGGGGDDVLEGGGGADLMDGQGGDDRVSGGGGADKLRGGGGEDTIVGGGGKDLLLGGGAADVFSFGAKDGRDRIRDWQDGADRLLFTAGAEAFGDLKLAKKGGDLLVKNGRSKILIEDLDRSDFDAGDVLFT